MLRTTQCFQSHPVVAHGLKSKRHVRQETTLHITRLSCQLLMSQMLAKLANLSGFHKPLQTTVHRELVKPRRGQTTN